MCVRAVNSHWNPLIGVVDCRTGTTSPVCINFILFVERTHKEHSRLNIRSAMILFSLVAVLPRRMLKCSSVLLNKVRARDRRYWLRATGEEASLKIHWWHSYGIFSNLTCHKPLVTAYTVRCTANLKINVTKNLHITSRTSSRDNVNCPMADFQ